MFSRKQTPVSKDLGAMLSLRFRLAGVEVALRISGADPVFIGNYREYASGGQDPNLEINVELQNDFPLGPVNPHYPAFETTRYSPTQMSLARMDAQGEICTPKHGPIVARFRTNSEPAGLEAIIRVCLSVALPTQGALILHSSAVAVGGTSFVFAGLSGAGKSTISSLLQQVGPVRKLADDLLVVSRQDEGQDNGHDNGHGNGQNNGPGNGPGNGSGNAPAGWRTQVAPFGGDTDVEAGETHALGSINFLVQAKTHRREPVTAIEAMGQLCQHVVSYTRAPRISQQVLQLAAQLVESTPCFRLEFANDKSVGEVLGITC